MGAGGKKHNNSCKTLRLYLGCNQINRQAFIAVFEWPAGRPVLAARMVPFRRQIAMCMRR
jgi:hypothetical protein